MSSNIIKVFIGDNTVHASETDWIGISSKIDNDRFILHDYTNEKLPFENNSVDIFKCEEVLQTIDVHKVEKLINNIYEILKPGGLLRISLPDYECDILKDRLIKNGNVLYDPGSGSTYDFESQTINGGTLWFPKFKYVCDILDTTSFTIFDYLHYYDDDNQVLNDIDYDLGFIKRTPDNDIRVSKPRRPMSIVIDCYKDDVF